MSVLKVGYYGSVFFFAHSAPSNPKQYVRMQRMVCRNLAVECLFTEINYQEIAQCDLIFYKTLHAIDASSLVYTKLSKKFHTPSVFSFVLVTF